jgi:hypothetical protein
MEHWHIEDDKVRELLVKNGFVCEKYTGTSDVSAPGIHFLMQTQEQIEASKWYVTDCPVKFNKSYTLPDGSVIASRGTALVVVRL